MQDKFPFASVVFAGGGNRCWWQAGFWKTVAQPLNIRPRVISSVSAGAAMACWLMAGRIDEVFAYYQKALAANPSNFQPKRLLGRQSPFPHLEIFQDAMRTVMDQAAMERLQAGPEIRVLLASPPAWAGAMAGALLGFAAYNLEKKLLKPLHPKLPLKLGFQPTIVRAGDCRTWCELSELLLQTACIPPIAPIMRRAGRPVLDGGLIDNAPLAAIDPGEGPTLVLLSRRYPPDKLQGAPGVTYLQPSENPPVGRSDYTNPQGVQETFDLGRRDGERFIKKAGLKGI